LVYRPLAQSRKTATGLHFCNLSCKATYFNKERSGEKHPNWAGGHSVYRDILTRAEVPPICRRCGFADVRMLAVHHLDGDRENNAIENLVWMCHNCHYLIHHYPDEMAAFQDDLSLTGL
jgi:hypothetical protein